jgi:predicted  nucleic acid-binding Zn-ribbon protein
MAVRSITEMAEQVEAELESALNEISRLHDEVGGLENDNSNLQSTIDEQDEYIAELEELVAFVKEHFPDAIAAFDVRERMEKASGD